MKSSGDTVPLVSVVMPVYNAEHHVGEAIESILNQSFEKFEFIVIDDGSTDTSWDIIQSYMKKDKRLRGFSRENRGIVSTRNEGASLCTTPYMCILDADDVACVSRLEKQFSFMENNREIAVVGGHTYIIDQDTNRTGYRRYLCSNNEIEKILYRKSPIAQPSACIRLDAFWSVGGYQGGYERIEDYKLWLDLHSSGHRLANLDEYLISYRVFDRQGKSTKLKHTLYETIKLQSEFIFRLQTFSLVNLVYRCGECFLLLLPKSVVLSLFKKFTYSSDE